MLIIHAHKACGVCVSECRGQLILVFECELILFCTVEKVETIADMPQEILGSFHFFKRRFWDNAFGDQLSEVLEFKLYLGQPPGGMQVA